MKDKLKCILLVAAAIGTLTGCGGRNAGPEESKAETSAQITETSEETIAETTDEDNEGSAIELSDLAALLGMNDEDTAELFGGGEENWTEDKGFFIGRIYSVGMYDETYNVYTTCDDEETVESVSVWIVNGDRDVTEEETQTWKDRVTEFMGTEPMEDPEISEGGSRNFRWRANGMAVSMHQMKDILTISIQPAVGELNSADTSAETASVQAEPADTAYEDNFDVSPEDAAAYAERIKTAVSDKDLEALAELTSFPVYVGLPDIGGVETREEFISLGADKIFTDELAASVTGADTADLTASMAGFVLTDRSSANIIFGTVDGRLAITGINY